MKCPNCGYEGPDDALECAQCSVVFSKWNAREERNNQPQDQPAILAESAQGTTSSVFAGLPVKKLFWAGAILMFVAWVVSIAVMMNKSSLAKKQVATMRRRRQFIINAQKTADKARQLNADIMLRSLQVAEEVTGKQNMATGQAVQEADQQ